MRKIWLMILLLTATTTACSGQDSKGGKKAHKGKKHHKKEAAGPASISGLTRTGSLAGVAESSGLALASEPGIFYTHGDHGNAPELYRINWQGAVLGRVTVPGASNEDWESLAHDKQGRLYIADVGNNTNKRRDLTIYRFDPAQPSVKAATIRFRYADQTAFPPTDKAARNFDCEAVVWHQGTLYLFTRDRGSHRRCRVYALPDAPAEAAVAQFVGEYALDGEVSGADISPDGRHLALIGREVLFLIDLPPGGNLTGGTVHTVPLPRVGQTEGIVFVDDRTLAISTEQGALYRYQIK